MNIEELQERWNAEKDFFRNKEIGELQDFIKNALQCGELFDLKKGLGSTPNKLRNNEFTAETSRENRRADLVIFIDGENIVIPVEIEKHGNIEAGVKQLFQYQKDWDKKYGILTDGNEWRFYRSNQYKKYTLDAIFNDPQDFVTYWHGYIKPENYYIELFNPSDSFDDKLDLNNPENRPIFFDEITTVIQNFKGKMKAIGAWELDYIGENEKVAVEISYAYLIQFILYKVLVDNKFTKFNEEYDKMFLRIQKAIQHEDFYSIITNDIKNISEYISKNIYKPFANEQKTINEKLVKDLKETPTIEDIAPWLDILIFINRYNFAGLKNEIFGFIYENYLKDLYQNQRGQYFTDPAVVNFMLEEIGYTTKKIKAAADDNISIVDPSCGAGTFLYSAVDKIINAFDDGTAQQSTLIQKLIDDNIFGLDIEEFPLYLAEMNILMRLLPLIVNNDYKNPIDSKLKIFKTKDSISEFLGTGISSKEDKQKDLGLDYPSFMRDETDLKGMFKSLQGNEGIRYRFDYVIGNPPYIGYNMCSKQEFAFVKKIQDATDKSITMANVYGVNLNTVPNRHKKNTPKPNLYAFFIALGLGLLKDGGVMSYIIPQTILTAKDLDVLRYHLSYFTTIEKIITFDGNLFVGRGLKQNKPVATSSLIFVVKKKELEKTHKIKIVNYNPYSDKDGIDFDKYINSRNKKTKEVLQSDLQESIANWNFIKHDKIFMDSYNLYKEKSRSIEEYRKYDLKDYDEICFDVGYEIDEKKLLKEESFYFYPKLEKQYYTIKNAKGYWAKEMEIPLLRSNQGHKLLDTKYKILWNYNNPKLFHFSDKNLISARNNICFIGSNNQQETLYLFSILNSFLIIKLLKDLLKSENEKAILVSLSSIKEFIRIPKIIESNNFIKNEIITQTEYLLSLEDFQLKDFVKFTTLKQQFKKAYVKENHLILVDNDNQETKQAIKSKPHLVQYLIEQAREASLFQGDVTLNEIKFMEAIDKEEQTRIKDYIDDLVFSLYFNVSVAKIGIQHASNIKKECKKHEFYNYINS